MKSDGWPKRAWVLVLALGLMVVSCNTRSWFLRPTAERGYAVLVALKEKYPQHFFGPLAKWEVSRPYGTTGAKAVLDLPEGEWNKLSGTDKMSLILYMEAIIPTIRANPKKYAYAIYLNSEDFLKEVARMCDDCWSIGEVIMGTIFGQTIAGPRYNIVQGDAAWEGDAWGQLGASRGSKASEYRRELGF